MLPCTIFASLHVYRPLSYTRTAWHSETDKRSNEWDCLDGEVVNKIFLSSQIRLHRGRNFDFWISIISGIIKRFLKNIIISGYKFSGFAISEIGTFKFQWIFSSCRVHVSTGTGSIAKSYMIHWFCRIHKACHWLQHCAWSTPSKCQMEHERLQHSKGVSFVKARRPWVYWKSLRSTLCR